MRRHPDVRVDAIPQKKWRKITQEAMKDQLDPPTTSIETCKWRTYVELVEYDEYIKKILGVTTESLALAETGSDVLYHVQGSETGTKNNRHNFLDNADIKSEPIDYGDYHMYDEEDIDMRFYCDDYEDDAAEFIDVENDSPSTVQNEIKEEVKLRIEKVTDVCKSLNRTSDSGKRKGKRIKLKTDSSISTSGESKRYGTNNEAPLSPSFHRPWQLPQSPKALPHPAAVQSSSVISHPVAKSPHLSSPVQPAPPSLQSSIVCHNTP